MIKICNECIKKHTSFTYEKKQTLKHLFNNYDTIEKNYSQMCQDLFVLSIFNGKTKGTFLEIGSGDPIEGNNTYLLENKFDWTGLGIEIEEHLAKKYNIVRKSRCLNLDATKVDYSSILNNINYIDYLQIDCDPAEQSYHILNQIPFDKVEFGVITFEHDFSFDKNKTILEKARFFLKNIGYELVVPNAALDPWFPFEDWWVNKKIINKNILNLFSYKKITCIPEHLFENYKINIDYVCNH